MSAEIPLPRNPRSRQPGERIEHARDRYPPGQDGVWAWILERGIERTARENGCTMDEILTACAPGAIEARKAPILRNLACSSCGAAPTARGSIQCEACAAPAARKGGA